MTDEETQNFRDLQQALVELAFAFWREEKLQQMTENKKDV